MNLIFEIPGRPKPQKQTVHGKGYHWDPSKKDSNWIRLCVSEQCKGVLRTPLDCAIYVKCTFTFTPPKTSKKRTLAMLLNEIKHTKRPDVDNCAYLVTNAMKGIVYKDDSQIWRLELTKLYGERESTIIQVSTCEDK